MKAPDKIYTDNRGVYAELPIFSQAGANVEYVRKDALLEWAKEHQEGERIGSYTWACYQIIIDKLEAIDMAIDAHSQPSLPSDVDDAAVEYAYNVDVTGNGGEDYLDDVRIAFKAGAEWQKGQMMKEAIDAHVAQSFNPCTEESKPTLHGVMLLYEDEGKPYLVAGDDTRIIILPKEDKK